MTKEELDIISKIQNYWYKINEFTCYERIFRLDSYLSAIINLIIDLKSIDNENSDKYSKIIDNIEYICKSREVFIAKKSHERAYKKNAYKKRMNEYENELALAKKQIQLELSYFLKITVKTNDKDRANRVCN